MRSLEALRCEVDTLLAPFALDAVDRDEADVIGRHLRGCARCRSQVAEHHEVASRLGDDRAPAPAAVWERISAQLERPATLRGRRSRRGI